MRPQSAIGFSAFKTDIYTAGLYKCAKEMGVKACN